MLRKLILRRHSSIPFLRYQSSYPKVDTNNDSIHVVSNSSFGEVTSLPNTDELLRRVVREHQSKDRKFFLPWGDDEAMDEIRSAIEKLTKLGVLTEFIEDACIKQENLFKALTIHGNATLCTLSILVESCQWTYEDAMRFFSTCSEQLLSVSPESIQCRLDVFLGRGILPGPRLANIVERCPPILFAVEPQKMDQTWEDISVFFYAKNIKKLLETSPILCLKDPKELERKYEYIHLFMAIEPDQLMLSHRWMNLTLEDIQDRHKFLQKTERYITPNPKKPQLSKGNPPIQEIFDSSYKEFAELAGVHVDEWMVFRQICNKERANSENDDQFTRIRPSQLREFERRPKDAHIKVDGEL